MSPVPSSSYSPVTGTVISSVKLLPPSIEATKAAEFSPPWAVIFTTTEKAFVGEPSTVILPPPSPVRLTSPSSPAVVAETGRQ